jgi:hypothetical protein
MQQILTAVAVKVKTFWRQVKKKRDLAEANQPENKPPGAAKGERQRPTANHPLSKLTTQPVTHSAGW